MSAWTSVFLGTGPANPSTTGTELAGSRRQVDFSDVMYGRHSYAGTGILTDCRIGIGVSTDGGLTWGPLLAPGPAVSAANYVFITEWTDIRAVVGNLQASPADVWVNALMFGSSLLGLTATVQMVELQLR